MLDQLWTKLSNSIIGNVCTEAIHSMVLLYFLSFLSFNLQESTISSQAVVLKTSLRLKRWRKSNKMAVTNDPNSSLSRYFQGQQNEQHKLLKEQIPPFSLLPTFIENHKQEKKTSWTTNTFNMITYFIVAAKDTLFYSHLNQNVW